MSFWLIADKEGKVYITHRREKPTKNSSYTSGWTAGYPGTALVSDDLQMFSLFRCLADDVRQEINRLPKPTWDGEPIEIEFKIKSFYYES